MPYIWVLHSEDVRTNWKPEDEAFTGCDLFLLLLPVWLKQQQAGEAKKAESSSIVSSSGSAGDTTAHQKNDVRFTIRELEAGLETTERQLQDQGKISNI